MHIAFDAIQQSHDECLEIKMRMDYGGALSDCESAIWSTDERNLSMVLTLFSSFQDLFNLIKDLSFAMPSQTGHPAPQPTASGTPHCLDQVHQHKNHQWHQSR